MPKQKKSFKKSTKLIKLKQADFYVQKEFQKEVQKESIQKEL